MDCNKNDDNCNTGRTSLPPHPLFKRVRNACSKNLLVDSSKLDITTFSGSVIFFIASEVASLTNIIAPPHYSSFQYTMNLTKYKDVYEVDVIESLHHKLLEPDHLNENDDSDEFTDDEYYEEGIKVGRSFCKDNIQRGGLNLNPFEIMGRVGQGLDPFQREAEFDHEELVRQYLEVLCNVVTYYTNEKKFDLHWEKKLVSIEQCSSNSIGQYTAVKFLNDDDTVVLEVPLRTSYIVRNYSWLAQAHLSVLPHLEKDSLMNILNSYARFEIGKDANNKVDSIMFIGSYNENMPNFGLPMTLIASRDDNELIWGWARRDVLGPVFEKDVFSPSVLEHSHLFKEKDSDDPTSNNLIRACTLTKIITCTEREAFAFCANALDSEDAKSNGFVGMYVANFPGGRSLYLAFPRDHIEGLRIKDYWNCSITLNDEE